MNRGIIINEPEVLREIESFCGIYFGASDFSRLLGEIMLCKVETHPFVELYPVIRMNQTEGEKMQSVSIGVVFRDTDGGVLRQTSGLNLETMKWTTHY